MRRFMIALVITLVIGTPMASGSSWNYSKASWYGLECGTRTASGVRLTKNSMTFAHKTMRFGTKVMFVYNGRRVVAVCTDRGPYIKGRIFDLGPGTAKALHFTGVGVVRWRIITP